MVYTQCVPIFGSLGQRNCIYKAGVLDMLIIEAPCLFGTDGLPLHGDVTTAMGNIVEASYAVAYN